MRRGIRRFFTGIGAGVRIIFSGRPILVGFLLLFVVLSSLVLRRGRVAH